ncbi:MAG: hypothetical protein M1835_001939 [Candelina submexicana]|nr:MAG: hypothetical protein M1835_001939 [Candelina submexicana]
MMGGKVYEVDILLARRLIGDVPSDSQELRLPSLEKNIELSMFILREEQTILTRALDCLPWDTLSWSIHRGLRDILVAFGKSTMDAHRMALGTRLRRAVSESHAELERLGWAADFVADSMGHIAATSVQAGVGNSGDSVRVVTAAASLCWTSSCMNLDETQFWRVGRHRLTDGDCELSTDAIVALTKLFILEWSIEFDCQMYHDLPTQFFFA